MRDGQLPVSVTLPGNATPEGVAGAAIDAERRIMPTEAEITAFFSVAGNMERFMDATASYIPRAAGVPAPVANNVWVPNIMLVPTAWAAYFVHPTSPVEVYALLEHLMHTVPDADLSEGDLL